MLSIVVMGGLGNQLFQVFTAIAYSMRNHVQLILPRDKLDIQKRPPYWNSFLRSLEPILSKRPVSHFIMLPEKSHEYTEIPYIDQNFRLYGYFQSYKYFEKEFEHICNIIRLEEQKELVREKVDYDISECISLHFRIGDYKNIQNAHPLMPLTYYERAIYNIIAETGKDEWKVLYFYEQQDVNDVEPAIQSLKNKYPKMEFVSVDHGLVDYEQMLLMSMCSHNIIANSSFSWWGAYFNTNKEKTVCYPSLWFGPALENSVKDMFPPDWDKIEI